MTLPKNGIELLQARQSGFKPKGIVLVTDANTKLANCQLIITPGIRYDFSMLKNLDVLLVLECDAKLRTSVRRWIEYTATQIGNTARELYVIPSYIYWGSHGLDTGRY